MSRWSTAPAKAFNVTQDEGLFRTILAQPADDAPRLVYADWLEEHGEPERAEFIRLQCERARLPEGSPRWWDLECREKQLWEMHQAEWFRSFFVAHTNLVSPADFF